jgi:hypothetical protein
LFFVGSRVDSFVDAHRSLCGVHSMVCLTRGPEQ